MLVVIFFTTKRTKSSKKKREQERRQTEATTVVADHIEPRKLRSSLEKERKKLFHLKKKTKKDDMSNKMDQLVQMISIRLLDFVLIYYYFRIDQKTLTLSVIDKRIKRREILICFGDLRSQTYRFKV